MTLILSNDDVEQLLTMPDCIAALEEAYLDLAEGRGVSRTRSDCITPTSHSPEAVYGLKSMDGVVPRLGVGAIRLTDTAANLDGDHIDTAAGRGVPVRNGDAQQDLLKAATAHAAVRP